MTPITSALLFTKDVYPRYKRTERSGVENGDLFPI